MVDMATYLMLDDVNTTLLEQYAGPAHAVAGYVNGRYANWIPLVAKYLSSGKVLVSIDVANNPAAGAQVLDIESGDATIADAPGWFKATQAAGAAAKDLRYIPKLYTSASNVGALIAAMTAAGIARSRYTIWSAHYTGSAHICSPSSCGYPAADATQWTDKYQGVSLDASLCYGYFFASGPPAVAPPAPVVAPAPAPVVLPAYGVPGGLKVLYSGVRLTWTPPAGAVPGTTSYHVQVEGLGGKVLYDVSTTDAFADVSNMTPGAEYLARIAAHADGTHQASPWSATVKITV